MEENQPDLEPEVVSEPSEPVSESSEPVSKEAEQIEPVSESDNVITEPVEESEGNACLKQMKLLIERGELTKDDVMNALTGGRRKRTKRRRGKRSKRTRR
jgi:hypothetical protein